MGCVLRQAGIEVLGSLTLHQPAGDAVAAFHELEVIEGRQLVLLGSDGLDEDLVVVVAEHEAVGQLHGGVPAHAHAGRDTLHNSALRGADGRGGAHGIVIGIQVHHTHQALADGAVVQGTLHIDEGVGQGLEDVVLQIFGHGGVDQRSVLRFLLGAELCLGEDQVDGRGGVTGVCAHALPVRGIRGKLVAGNDCPLVHGIHLREENVSR